LGRAVPLSNSDRALMLLLPVAEALYAVDANRQLTISGATYARMAYTIGSVLSAWAS
jgi:hypothetical protein